MKVMLIGGTGVLSKDIAAQCITSNFSLYMINRGNRKEYIPKGSNVLIGDIINEPDTLFSKLEGLCFDVVVDFISYTPEQLSKKLQLFKDKCKQYIFISSATVYSNEFSSEYITEKTPVTNYSWNYSKNKILCEELLADEWQKNGLHYTIVRPYITYGDTRIPFAFNSKKNQWTLVDRIINEQPVVVWDNGENLCTLTHTKDFANGIIGLFMNTKAFEQAFHITSEENLPWSEVLNKIAEAVNKKARVIFIPSDVIELNFIGMKGELTGDKAITRKFDNTKIKSIVNDYFCDISFSEGIKKTINNYQKSPELIKIDHEWNAKVNHLIYRYNKHNTNEIRDLKTRISDEIEFFKSNIVIIYYKFYRAFKRIIKNF